MAKASKVTKTKAKEAGEIASPAPRPASFEEALAEIETLTETMEEASLPLGEMVKAFERGRDLLNFCQKSLTSARESIELIETRKAQGPADDDSTTKSPADSATYDDDVRLF